MQKIVVDTNILFSFLLKKNEEIRKVLFSEKIKIFTTYHLIIEIFRHKEKLLKYSQLSEVEIEEGLLLFLEKIIFIPWKEIPSDYKMKAYHILKHCDLKDIPFLALSLYIDAKLWTGDKNLCKFLKKAKLDICITTKEFLNLFYNI